MKTDQKLHYLKARVRQLESTIAEILPTYISPKPSGIVRFLTKLLQSSPKTP